MVTDSNGNAVAGAQTNWTVTKGGGSLSAASTTTNASGLTSTTLTLGKVNGENQLVAVIAASGGTAIFGSIGDPGSAVSIGPSSGNNQTGTVGAALPKSLTAICLDKYGNGASHTQVNWTVVSGGRYHIPIASRKPG